MSWTVVSGFISPYHTPVGLESSISYGLEFDDTIFIMGNRVVTLQYTMVSHSVVTILAWFGHDSFASVASSSSDEDNRAFIELPDESSLGMIPSRSDEPHIGMDTTLDDVSSPVMSRDDRPI